MARNPLQLVRLYLPFLSRDMTSPIRITCDGRDRGGILDWNGTTSSTSSYGLPRQRINRLAPVNDIDLDVVRFETDAEVVLEFESNKPDLYAIIVILVAIYLDP
ncbi:hypothetical protein AX15_002065 [Amanita polypyramis BW_CC]|nr:hypothetical protein AX15_002065 [Amanita polypyramis BW_CC]